MWLTCCLVAQGVQAAQWEDGWLYFDEDDPAQIDLGTFRLER